MNPVIYIPQSKRLLEQLCELLRYKHYSLKTEQAYCYWLRFFVRWCGRGGRMRHPRDMGAPEVTQFLTMLANEPRVSVSTHNQAHSFGTDESEVAAGGTASPLDVLEAA
jgi:hypothetical protein